MNCDALPRSRPFGVISEHAGRLLLKFALPLAGMLLLVAFTVAQAAQVEVKMSDKPPRYEPEKVAINVGDTVEWVNSGQTLHTVTADPAKSVNKSNVSLPAGAKPFDSGFMPPGTRFKHTFTVPGTYKYFCIPHEKDGMIGYVVVKKK